MIVRGVVLATLVAAGGIALANQQVMGELSRPWRAIGVTSPGLFDIAIVPGSRVDGLQPVPMLEARLATALNLYRAARVRRILVTGNGTAGEPTAMKHWLVMRGVPESAILVDDAGMRTMESMRHASELGLPNAVVCTQHLHMARSLFLAREAGLEAVGAEAVLDPGYIVRWQIYEVLKRTLAFAEVRVLGRLQRPAPVLASRAELD
jgi:SanA protein